MAGPESNLFGSLFLQQQLVSGPGYCSKSSNAASVKKKLDEWKEADSLKHCNAEYAQFHPAPRSTIALCYNCRGDLLASTHGDHTVKITSCRTGKLLRVLSGHRRTPWVVRFHPTKPHLLASGSLDHEVRLWDASTGDCIARHTFGKPIASLAFHIDIDLLAIACGHKLYMWEHSSGKSPSIVLKTRRSMRAVHFHPHGLPLVLTAEVQDPSVTEHLPSSLTEEGSFIDSAQQQTTSSTPMQTDHTTLVPPSHTESSSSTLKRKTISSSAPVHVPDTTNNPRRYTFEASTAAQSPLTTQWEQLTTATFTTTNSTNTPQIDAAIQVDDPRIAEGFNLPARINTRPAQQQQTAGASLNNAPANAAVYWGAMTQQLGDLPPSMIPMGNELPFPGNSSIPFPPGGASAAESAQFFNQLGVLNPQLMAAFSAAAWNIIGEEQPPRVRLRLWRFDAMNCSKLLESSTDIRMELSDAVLCSEMGVHFSPCGRHLAATLACRAPAPPPPLGHPSPSPPEQQPLGIIAQGVPVQQVIPGSIAIGGTSRSTHRLGVIGSGPIPSSAVEPLEMFDGGTSGMTLATAMSAPPLPVAITGSRTVPGLPAVQSVQEEGGQEPHSGAPTDGVVAGQPPEKVVYEVRVYSIDGPTFGQVLRAKRIRAAHCLTSVQFSPTSDHMLLAYGKKHVSLLRSLVAEGNNMVALHTILEVFRLSDMEVVRVLPSAEDEINAACFHPSPGGGIAYGTKEGRLRVISHYRGNTKEEDGDVVGSVEEPDGSPMDVVNPTFAG